MKLSYLKLHHVARHIVEGNGKVAQTVKTSVLKIMKKWIKIEGWEKSEYGIKIQGYVEKFFGNLFVEEVVLVPVWIRTWRIKFAFIECINQPFISHFIIMICSTYSLNHPFISHSQAIMILTYKNILWREWEKSFLSKKVSGIAGFYSNIPHTFACKILVGLNIECI